MKNLFCLSFYLLVVLSSTISTHQVMAQDSQEAQVTVMAENEPLGNILETITQETGYTFILSNEWKTHLVSASIRNLPLEQGLKRLLRSLNHTITWESDKLVTINIFGKVDPRKPKPAASRPVQVRTYQEKIQPAGEPENVPPEQEEPEEDTVKVVDEKPLNEAGEEGVPEPEVESEEAPVTEEP